MCKPKPCKGCNEMFTPPENYPDNEYCRACYLKQKGETKVYNVSNGLEARDKFIGLQAIFKSIEESEPHLSDKEKLSKTLYFFDAFNNRLNEVKK